MFSIHIQNFASYRSLIVVKYGDKVVMFFEVSEKYRAMRLCHLANNNLAYAQNFRLCWQNAYNQLHK